MAKKTEKTEKSEKSDGKKKGDDLAVDKDVAKGLKKLKVKVGHKAGYTRRYSSQ